jgi:hypothetical protein
MNRPVRVAKIGRKDHAPAPLPASLWRAYLRHLAKWMLITLAVLLVSATVLSVSGCSTWHAREVCGALPDGSEICTGVKERGHA